METPIGTIVAFGGEKLDQESKKRWMFCDGTEISRSRYRELFSIIGTSWGKGSSDDTFNVPDLRGFFLRGLDQGTKRDPDAANRVSLGGEQRGDNVGSYQDDAIQTHRHANQDHTHNFGHGLRHADGDRRDPQALTRESATTSTATSGIVGGDLKITEPEATPGTNLKVAAETRPKNAGVLYIIRVK